MIIASPIDSKKPESISARPNDMIAIGSGFLKSLSRPLIFRAARTPKAVAPSQMPKAFAAIMPMRPQSTPVPPAPCAEITPRPIASTMMPSTSSITAPAIVVTPSSESMHLRSERMRAVMPTEVAVPMTPRNSAAGDRKPMGPVPRILGIRRTAQRSPRMNEPITPPTPTSVPASEYRTKSFMSVSTPERKSRTIDATVQKPYSSGVTGNAAPSTAGNTPPEKNEPRAMPPSAYGPIRMPEASSPRTAGSLIFSASMPPNRAAKRITPIWMASIVILWVMPPPSATAPSEAKAESDIERKRAKAEKRFLRFIEVNELKRLLS